jgi:prepilin-type N-terminal cleavage/methylation domain-containing protein
MGFLRKCGEMRRIRLNSRARKAFLGRSRGFTLIEVVVAVALLGIIGVTVLSGLSTAAASLILADRRATAESLARSQMEYVKNQEYSPAATGGAANYMKIPNVPLGYTIWSVNRNEAIVNGGGGDLVIAIPWDTEGNTPADDDKGLQKIKLVVKYEGEEIITLEGYKRRRGG